MPLQIPDITQNKSWQFTVALFGGIFSVVALIYRPEFIVLGLVIFLYGLISHILHIVVEKLTTGKVTIWTFLLVQAVLVSVSIVFVTKIL